MKKKRITVQLVLEVPANAKLDRVVHIKGGGTVVNKGMTVTATEDIGDVALPHEMRRAECYTVRKLFQELVDKLGIFLNVDASTSWNDDGKPNGIYVHFKFNRELDREVSAIVDCCENNSWGDGCGHTICKKNMHEYLDFIIKEGEIYKEDDNGNSKRIGPLGDPNLIGPTKMLNKQYGWIRTFIKNPYRYNLDQSYAAKFSPKRRKKAKAKK